MSRICLFVLFLTLGISVRFGENKNTKDDVNCTKSESGSNETRLSFLEEIAKTLELPIDAVQNILNVIKRSNRNSSTLQRSSRNVPLIFPGTLWCGAQNIAKHKNDVGFFNAADACCKAHDKCNFIINAGKTKENLQNNGLFRRSACTCDNKFHKCLKNVSSIITKTIGDTYFNILGPQCFKCICPTHDCQYGNTDDPNCDNHCTKYKWIDNPEF
ncbi:phospholipase A2-like [Anoplolepis gracilipes]|uniref:phospholipase A2-like n=1 Tax=Anoplolepis gracilipes TaxID=354296 RepID=UPI003B9F2424